MVREISKKNKIPMKAIAAVVIFFIIVGIILILIGFYCLLTEWDYLTYLNLTYAEGLLLAGVIITSLAVIGGTVIPYRRKIISEIHLIIFLIICISGIIICLVGFYIYRNGWSIWMHDGGIPPIPNSVKKFGNLVFIGGSIAILDSISVIITLICAIRKK